MKFEIDTESRELIVDGISTPLYSTEGFQKLSELWLKVGWNQKHLYSFTWLGRPIIQLPDDILRVQEVIWKLKPDVIIETGIAHGGSLIFYASLCKMIGHGKVVGIDIDIRAHNRKEIEKHDLYPFITMFEGSSIEPEMVEQVKAQINPGDKVLVLLDSNHTYEHVSKELELYSDLVSVDSYIVSTDGLMKDLTDVPRGEKYWDKDNPSQAALDFVSKHENFEISYPDWLFNESDITFPLTHWPNAWVKRIR